MTLKQIDHVTARTVVTVIVVASSLAEVDAAILDLPLKTSLAMTSGF